MSFYGNITNTTKTNFTFDRTYPNRTEMEINMKSDNVYIGRFVLVDYDQDSENVRRAYFDLNEIENLGDDTVTYLFSDAALTFKIQFNSSGMILDEDGLVTGVNKDDILYLRLSDGTKDFFICVGEYAELDEDGNLIGEKYAEFKRFTQGPDYEGIYRWNYAVNYNTDQTNYGDKFNTSIGRGWDSTVWQKVFENGVEKYVMIAELNAVVPSFTISADAPSIMPVAPHFDEVSNNTYYELHAQPQWGVRIKHGYNHLTADPPIEGTPGVDYIHYEPLSDMTGYWIQAVENKELGITQYYYYSSLDGGMMNTGSWELVDIDYPADGTPVSFSKVLDYVSRDIMSPQALNIFLNAKGFVPTNSHSYSGRTDKINLYPTGYSQTPIFKKNEETGQVDVEWVDTEYNDHTRGKKIKKPDTLELGIELPSLGNALNTIWNIVYGVGIDGNGEQRFKYNKNTGMPIEVNGRPIGENGYLRTTFIDWVDGEETVDNPRMRLVQGKETGNGFEYKVDQVETLAGCINSVHDLMGMIIVDKSKLDLTDKNAVAEFIKKTDADKIYYLNDGGFYRRGTGYEYTTLDYKYEKIEVIEDEYQENFYYYLTEDGTYKPDLNSSFDSNKEYYIKKIDNPEEEYQVIELDQYEQYKYYYLSGDDYMNEHNITARNVQYYEYSGNIQRETSISMDFVEGKYWELLDNGNYQPTIDKEPGQEKYYIINNKKTLVTHILENPNAYDKVNETYQGKILSYFWSPGAFAVKNVLPDGTITYRLTDMDSEYDPDLEYYMLDYARTTNVDASTGEVYYIPEIKNAYKVNLIEIGDKKYYRQVYSTLTGKYTYFLATQEIINEEYKDLGRARLDPANGYPDNYVPSFSKNNYYTLDDIDIYTQNHFYITNKYYYNDEEDKHKDSEEKGKKPEISLNKGNFIKDKSLKYTEGRVYYTLLEDTFIPIENPFYVPNKYYQQYFDETTGNIYYILDKSFKKNELTYYDRKYFYVESDLEGLYAIGSQWNRGVEEIPCTIELASIEEVYEMKLLTGFARTFNTIHGLIVEINKLLLFGDYHTRDRNTVQGCINLMNDIINRFDEFLPTRFLISDNYGRLASADRETNEWIDIDIIGDPGKPKVRFEHEYPYKKDNTTSNLNLNDEKEDSIQLETISLDETGHVTNTDTKTVTLPYGYKIFTDGQNEAIAENTQDTFTFNDDTWVSATINEKTLQIVHEYPNEAVLSIGQEQDKNPNFGQTFKSVYIEKDEKGHIRNAVESIITLPKGSLSSDFNNDNNARVLTGIGFIPSSGKISYSQNNVGNLLLTGYSGGSSNEVNASDTIIQAFYKLQTSLNNTNIKLNQEVQNLTNTIGTVEQSLSNNINSVNTSLSGQVNSLNTKIDNNYTTLNNNINTLTNTVNDNYSTLNNSIIQIKTSLGVSEGETTITSVEEQIAAALEDFKTNILKDYALITYVDEEIKKVTQVNTETIV